MSYDEAMKACKELAVKHGLDFGPLQERPSGPWRIGLWNGRDLIQDFASPEDYDRWDGSRVLPEQPEGG